MVSTSYPANVLDWRGLFIRHLVDALARRTDLALQLWAPPGDIPGNVRPIASDRESQWLAQLMAAGGLAHVFRSRGLPALAKPVALLWMLRKVYRRNSASAYHVNWLQNSLALPNDGRPLLIAVLGTDLKLLRLPLMRSWLRRVFRNRRVVICPNAEWMVPILEQAFGSVTKIRFVPFGIDPNWLEVERLPSASSPQAWLCVSRLTKDKLGPLLDWGTAVFADGKRELHLFGPMQEQITLPGWVNYHGPVTPDALCNDWFPRAHGLISLSQHSEGRPQVMLEAMAAGLPIIASRLLAHSDIIADGESGFLCDSASSVKHALDTLENMEANRRMGENGRKWVIGKIGTWDDCASRYAALYRELLDECAS